MKRDFTYIDDIVSGIIQAIKKNYPYEVFNLGNSRSEHLLDMVRIIEENLGKKAIIEKYPMQMGDVPESFADIKSSMEKLNYCPKTNIDVGIKSFVRWFKDYNKTFPKQ